MKRIIKWMTDAKIVVLSRLLPNIHLPSQDVARHLDISGYHSSKRCEFLLVDACTSGVSKICYRIYRLFLVKP
ncbi:hypothetical protein Ahy_A03g013116 isoform E [Arachis hypogaea]|uniref:Uncharacterized protein n=1 Tax=Arachis hypogaea TaxID=3818 RepID=A0A445DUS9_ARAHY|nr:hypothetical protein Ahy_A03g013116 isoform E [Arachis hypogaea]